MPGWPPPRRRRLGSGPLRRVAEAPSHPPRCHASAWTHLAAGRGSAARPRGGEVAPAPGGQGLRKAEAPSRSAASGALAATRGARVRGRSSWQAARCLLGLVRAAQDLQAAIRTHRSQ